MTSASGWSELDSSSPRSRGGDRRPSGFGNGLRVTPFTQLARVHGLSVVADGLITVALAGSIFFQVDPSDARWRVALYLVLTIAPFAIVTPLLGPAIDRAQGGRRGMIIGSLAARAVVAFFMTRHIDSLLLFPEAFAMLVLQKGYAVSRTAIVPGVCPREDELIEANSKLALLSSIGGLTGAAIGGILVALAGGGGATILAMIVYVFGAVTATRLPQVQVAAEPADVTERLEVRGANIVLSATAVGVLRGIVGFTTFLLAFHLRAGEDGVDRSEPGSAVGAALGTIRDIDVVGEPGPPSWHLGVAALAAGMGALLGARYAPDLRDRIPEERLVFGALVAIATTALLGAWGGGITGTALLALGVGFAAAVGKLGFDALVQRDAPRANHGRAFAVFEGRFQLSWAVGAFLAVIFRVPIELGALLIAIAAGLSATSYELGRRTDRVQRSSRVRQAIRERVPDEAVERFEAHPAVARVKPVMAGFGRLRERVAPHFDPLPSAPKSTAPSDPIDPIEPVAADGEAPPVTPPAGTTGESYGHDQTDVHPVPPPGHGPLPPPPHDPTMVAPLPAPDAVDPTTISKRPPPLPGKDDQYRLWDD